MPKKSAKPVKTNAELLDAILAAVEANHIWINAFSLIRPDEKTLATIGQSVVSMLKEKSNLLPTFYGKGYDGPITDIQKLTPVLYLSVNAS